MDKSKEDLYLLLHHDSPDGQYSWTCGKVFFTVVTLAEDGTPRNLSEGQYEDFQVRAQYNQEEIRLYGYGIHYKNAFSVDLYRAKEFVKTLGRIERRMTRFEKEWGSVSSFGNYAQRVAKAIGIKAIIKDVSTTTHRRHSDGTYQIWQISELPWLIDHIVTKEKERTR